MLCGVYRIASKTSISIYKYGGMTVRRAFFFSFTFSFFFFSLIGECRQLAALNVSVIRRPPRFFSPSQWCVFVCAGVGCGGVCALAWVGIYQWLYLCVCVGVRICMWVGVCVCM